MSNAYKEVGTLKEIGAQVGDVVREAHFPSKKVIAYNDGEPEPWVLECLETKEIDYWAGDYAGWRIISRAQTGPVRTVTRHEIVPGTYGHIWIDEVEPGWIAIGMRNNALKKLDAVGLSFGDLDDMVKTLTAIRDAMQANATA